MLLFEALKYGGENLTYMYLHAKVVKLMVLKYELKNMMLSKIRLTEGDILNACSHV